MFITSRTANVKLEKNVLSVPAGRTQTLGEMQMASKRTVLAVAITTVALTAGSLGSAVASTKSGTSTKTTFRSVSTQVEAGKVGGAERLKALLAALVAKGTITQVQADAVIAAQAAAKAAHEANKGAREAGKSVGKRVKGELLAIISSTTGIDSITVTNRIKAGESLAAIAGAKTDALIAAIIADHNKRIDAAVSAGTVTAAQAVILKAKVATHVTKLVNATPAPLFRGGKGGGKAGKGGVTTGAGLPA